MTEPNAAFAVADLQQLLVERVSGLAREWNETQDTTSFFFALHSEEIIRVVTRWSLTSRHNLQNVFSRVSFLAITGRFACSSLATLLRQYSGPFSGLSKLCLHVNHYAGRAELYAGLIDRSPKLTAVFLQFIEPPSADNHGALSRSITSHPTLVSLHMDLKKVNADLADFVGPNLKHLFIHAASNDKSESTILNAVLEKCHLLETLVFVPYYTFLVPLTRLDRLKTLNIGGDFGIGGFTDESMRQGLEKVKLLVPPQVDLQKVTISSLSVGKCFTAFSLSNKVLRWALGQGYRPIPSCLPGLLRDPVNFKSVPVPKLLKRIIFLMDECNIDPRTSYLTTGDTFFTTLLQQHLPGLVGGTSAGALTVEALFLQIYPVVFDKLVAQELKSSTLSFEAIKRRVAMQLLSRNGNNFGLSIKLPWVIANAQQLCFDPHHRYIHERTFIHYVQNPEELQLALAAGLRLDERDALGYTALENCIRLSVGFSDDLVGYLLDNNLISTQHFVANYETFTASTSDGTCRQIFARAALVEPADLRQRIFRRGLDFLHRRSYLDQLFDVIATYLPPPERPALNAHVFWLALGRIRLGSHGFLRDALSGAHSQAKLNINDTNPESGVTVFHYVSGTDEKQFLEFLQNPGLRSETLIAQDKDGNTPLHRFFISYGPHSLLGYTSDPRPSTANLRQYLSICQKLGLVEKLMAVKNHAGQVPMDLALELPERTELEILVEVYRL